MRASFVVVVVVVVVGRVFFDPNEDHTPGQARFAILEKKPPSSSPGRMGLGERF
jgi:hypothetical protein